MPKLATSSRSHLKSPNCELLAKKPSDSTGSQLGNNVKCFMIEPFWVQEK